MKNKFLSKKLAASAIMFLTFTNLSYASVVKIADFLVHEAGVEEALSKFGIRGSSARQVKRYVSNSMSSLYYKRNQSMTASQLRKMVRNLRTTGGDTKYKKELMILLNKPADQMSQEDLVTAINDLIYLANRHGRRGASILACSNCVSESLHNKGFKFTLEVLSDTKVKYVLDKILPKNPKKLSKYITTKMRTHNLGHFAGVSNDLIAPEEEKSLALFLGLKEFGSKKQKAFIDSIIEISKDGSGKTKLLNSENPHKFWKLFSEEMSDVELDKWTKLMKEVSTQSNGKINKKEAFFSVLNARAASDGQLKDRVMILKNKGCFFN